MHQTRIFGWVYGSVAGARIVFVNSSRSSPSKTPEKSGWSLCGFHGILVCQPSYATAQSNNF